MFDLPNSLRFFGSMEYFDPAHGYGELYYAPIETKSPYPIARSQSGLNAMKLQSVGFPLLHRDE